jgi:arabinofuranosyltransferase
LLRIGGDFMLGRFLTPPLLMATILIGRCQLLRTRALLSIPFAAAVLALGVWAPRTPLRAPLQPKPSVDVHGVADERLIYALHSSLAARRGNAVMPDHYWADAGRALRRAGSHAVLVRPNVGFLGYFAGPLVHIIDQNALTDPLLARLPIAPGEWRIGHFTRAIPDGYVETVATGSNKIADPRVARLYERLALVTRDPLFRWRRLVAVIRQLLV